MAGNLCHDFLTKQYLIDVAHMKHVDNAAQVVL